MDRRIGFAETVGGTNTFYYYLADHVGTVLRIVKEDGTVVNQYDYDAFGRVRWNSPNTWEQPGLENRYLFQGREWDKNGGFYYFRNRIYLPERGEFATPDMNLGRGILGELDGMATLTFCGGDPVNCIDPTGLSVLSWMLGYGFSGAEATAFEQGFAEGYDGGSTIAANSLTFGQIDSLRKRSEALVAEDDMYRTSQGLANFGRSMLLAAGGTAALNGGMAGLGALAAEGGAVGTAATVTKGAVEFGLAGLAAKSAGDNLGTAAGEIDAGKYGWATFHASLGLLDVYSAGTSSYGGYKTFSPKVVASSPSPEVNSNSSSSSAANTRVGSTWNSPVEVGGRRVYQRDDLFEASAENIARMRQGRPPAGFDGEPVNLHHLIQQEPGAIAEVGGKFHSDHTKVLHGLVEPKKSFRYSSDGKTTEAEKAFRRWSYMYWKQRAKGL